VPDFEVHVIHRGQTSEPQSEVFNPQAAHRLRSDLT